MARAMATFCFMPVENLSIFDSAKLVMPNRSIFSLTRLAASGSRFRSAKNCSSSRGVSRPYRPISPDRNPIEPLTSDGFFTMSKPFKVAVPEVGFSRVASTRRAVVFPAPFGPSNPKISPA